MRLSAKHGLQPIPAVVLSVALFVILDLSILILNFSIARQIDEDSLAINLAGRQRMLSQQMAKQILEQRLVTTGSARWNTLEQEFASSRSLFETTLTAFKNGGEVIDSAGRSVELRARQDSEVKAILEDATQLWNTYQVSLAKAAESNNSDEIDLSQAQPLLQSVNLLTTVLEHQARSKANLLRAFQSAAVFFVLINFGVIIWQVRRRFQSVASSNEMLHNLVDKMNTAVLLFDEKDNVHYANKAALSLFEYTSENLIGRSRAELLQDVDDSILGRKKDGSHFVAHMELGELVFEGNPTKVVTINDITHHQELQVRWQHLAHHDSLTQLPNRLFFEHRIQQEFSAARRHDEIVGLLTLDLDNFKMINDSYGHQVGDEVLRQCAQRFRECVREEDLVARLGGDEFVIVLTRLPADETATLTARTVCKSLLEAITSEVSTSRGNIRVHGSIGVSFYPTDGEILSEVMRKSDASMYRAKSTGGGCEILLQS